MAYSPYTYQVYNKFSNPFDFHRVKLQVNVDLFQF